MQINRARLRRRRLEAGLSLRGLAVKAAVSHDTVMEIERGDRINPHPGTIRKIADALGVGVGDLVDWEAEGDGTPSPKKLAA